MKFIGSIRKIESELKREQYNEPHHDLFLLVTVAVPVDGETLELIDQLAEWYEMGETVEVNVGRARSGADLADIAATAAN